MTSGVPWQVEGVRPQARETAQEAARRSGMSVGEWLDSIISDCAQSEGLEPARHPRADDHDDAADINERAQPRHAYADYDVHRGRAPAEDIAEVRGRLDEVGRQLDQLSRLNATQAYLRPEPRADETPRELADVISKLDRRLDQLIASGRLAGVEVEGRGGAADREVANPSRERPAAAHAVDPSTPLEQALTEIAERQRALDADGGPTATSSPRSDVLPRAPTQGLSSLEEQLRQVTTRIETLRPCGVSTAVETLRDDLAEIGLMLKEAMPRQSIEALEIEVRGLSERLRLNRQTEGTDAAIAGVERGLAEIRDALRALTPAENLLGVDETVRELSRKIDLIAFNSQDPAAMEQLEGAIVGLRGIATQVASDGALAKLSDDVRALAAKVDQIASSGGLLSTLEQRISSIADVLEARHQVGTTVPSDLDAVVKGLGERLERLGLNRSDQAAVGQLEERITHLVEKLDTSTARLDHLDSIERALADLLVFLERQPDVPLPAAPPSPEVTSLRQDVQQTQSSLENVQGALEHLIDRFATIETDIRMGSPVPAAAKPAVAPAALSPALPPAAARAPHPAPAPAPPPAVPTARAAERNPEPPATHEHRPIDPNLPPDHPLEPGATRGRTGNSPVDRIAASEAALGPVKPPVIPDQGGSKSNFIAAARRAAQAANTESALRNEKPAPAPATNNAPKGKSAPGWGNRVRSLLVAVSVVVIVLGSLHLVASLFGPARDSGDESRPQDPQFPPKGDQPTVVPETPAATDGPTVPSPRMPVAPAPGRQSLVMPTDGETPLSIPAGVLPAEPLQQQAAASPLAGNPAVAAEKKDITGSISRPVAPPAMPASEPASALPPHGAIDKLPAAVGGSLRTAAAKGDPAAEYEIAQRYAEGRGVPQNLAEAADWFDRAAKQGLAPAQFRLGGFYEKGFGVKKDLDAARRLYLAAAAAGNAKAMHNLAVLYAEGIDGKPDYQNAAKWFRKAADYGLGDSQYNLGILFGRGIGMEPNLAEAYKWFTLAARDGDKESIAKRDDVGGRLDPQSLAAAKLAAQAWTPLEQPDAATQAATPAGGWDTVAAPPPGNPKPRNPGAKADRSIPFPVR
jgi:localization factor PodJL